jgi:carbamoyltransferase
MQNDVWIAGIARGHNAGICLLKNGEIVFSIEEERLSRRKYDGGPLASMVKVLDYTDKLDYLVIAHTQSLDQTAGRIDFSGDDMYTGLARKLGLIDQNIQGRNHPQVIDLSMMHHRLHAAAAFYRSPFDEAVSVIIDGAGSVYPVSNPQTGEGLALWEYESIFECSYPANFKTKYKHLGCRDPLVGAYVPEFDGEPFGDEGTIQAMVSDRGGIVKAYEAVTQYCGWQPIEAGKTMGLFPYGNLSSAYSNLYDENAPFPGVFDRNMFIPNVPNAAWVNEGFYPKFQSSEEQWNAANGDPTKLQNRRDLAAAIQMQSQEEAIKLIKKAVELTGKTNVVVSGGYGLNCVANYEYLEALSDEGINLYVEPISNDAGTAMGAALLYWHGRTDDETNRDLSTLYLGPDYKYTLDDIAVAVAKYEDAVMTDATDQDIVNLMTDKNIVTIYQGRSENGPRALGNRSILFDPTFEDGKDYVNLVKNREYFRPFAGSILAEDVHDWFDLRGMDETPHMMYAVDCKDGVEEKIPSIIHVDGTCRIQTVTEEQNPLYYSLIKAFKEKTGIPIVFNTSFNLGGDPLVETIDDAIQTLMKSDIEYLYLPEHGKMIIVKND